MQRALYERRPAMGNGNLSPDALPPRNSNGGGDWWRRPGGQGFAGGGGGYLSKDLEGIPSWGGTATRWRRYKKDVALWIEGINLDVSWSWAARMVRCLSGPAKTLAESIPMVELRATGWTWVSDAVEGDEIELGDDDDGPEERGHWEEPDLMAGINRLMEVLATMGVDEPTRRGQVMTYFYKQLHRRTGED